MFLQTCSTIAAPVRFLLLGLLVCPLLVLSSSAWADRCTDRKEIPWIHDTPMNGEPGTWTGQPPLDYVEKLLEVVVVSMSELEDGSGMAVILGGISSADGAIASDPVYWPGLKLQTELSSCDADFCYTSVPATRSELELHPEAQVSVCTLPE